MELSEKVVDYIREHSGMKTVVEEFTDELRITVQPVILDQYVIGQKFITFRLPGINEDNYREKCMRIMNYLGEEQKQLKSFSERLMD